MPSFRFILAVGLFAFALPLAADAESWKRCQTMTRQVEHFYGILDLAKERENELWEQATLKHIVHLEKRRLAQCPKFIARSQQIAAMVRHKQNVEEMKKLMEAAAKAAAKYYTGGLY